MPKSGSVLSVTILLGACILFVGIINAAITPYRGIVAIDGLGMSNNFYAGLLTLSSIGAAAGSMIFGYYSDKISDRRLLVLACAVLGTIGYGMVWLLPNQISYTVAFCVVLPFGMALFSQCFSYARSFLNENDHPRAEFMISVLRSLYAAGWVVAPPLVGWIAATFSVFDVFLVALVAQLACMAIFGFLMTRPSTKIGKASVPPVPRASDERALPLDKLLGLSGVAILRVALVISMTVFPLFMTNDIGAGFGELGLAAALAAALEIPFMLLWGLAAGRWGKEPILVINGVLFGVYLIGMYYARGLHDVLILQGVNALASAALLSITISYVQDAIRGRVGLSTSLFDVMGVIAGFASAGLFALLAKPESYSAVLLAGGAISVLGSILLAGAATLRSRTFQWRSSSGTTP